MSAAESLCPGRVVPGVAVSVDYQPRDFVKRLGWTNTLPDGWKPKPLRAAVYCVVSNVDKVKVDGESPVQLCNYTDVYHNEFIRPGLDFMRATASQAEIARFALSVDDVVITKDSEAWDDIGVPALVVETLADLICGYHLALLRPRKDVIDGAFLFRCLQAKPIQVQLALSANGVTRFGLPKSAIGAAVVPVPPLARQRAIAKYLNRETARLDALVAEKERLLSLLEDKRRALVTRSVLRGAEPRVTLRDSGIPRAGEIPIHWQTRRLRFLVHRIEQGWSPEAHDRMPAVDEWGVLKLNAVNRGRFDATATKTLPPNREPSVLFEVRPGDVLVTRSNTPSLVGDACYVEATRARLILSDLIYRLTVRSELIDGRFLVYFLTLPTGRSQIERDARGTSASMVKISQEHIRNWRVPVPPVEEQREIVAEIVSTTTVIDQIETATNRSIALLKERRSALIAAAVTGQIDVGGAA